jgi:hypothetical protein
MTRMPLKNVVDRPMAWSLLMHLGRLCGSRKSREDSNSTSRLLGLLWQRTRDGRLSRRCILWQCSVGRRSRTNPKAFNRGRNCFSTSNRLIIPTCNTVYTQHFSIHFPYTCSNRGILQGKSLSMKSK